MTRPTEGARDRRRPTCCADEHRSDLVERSLYETLTYDAFPDIMQKDPNQQARGIMREIRRRTRVGGACPDGSPAKPGRSPAALNRLNRMSTKRYMNMRPLYQPKVMQTEPRLTNVRKIGKLPLASASWPANESSRRKL